MSCGNVNLAVPDGFQDLLGDLSREILRKQPKNIPKFSAEYFQQMLEKRSGRLINWFFSK